MLSAILDADAFTESRAKWAYRAVVWTCVWPSSFPIIGRLSPSASAREAKLCRKSWMRMSSSPARARMRRQGCCRSVRWAPSFLPAMTQGLSGSRGRAARAPSIGGDGAGGARLEAELGYGFRMQDGVLTPCARFGYEVRGRRRYRLGTRFDLGAGLAVGLQAERKEGAAAPEHGARIDLRLRW